MKLVVLTLVVLAIAAEGGLGANTKESKAVHVKCPGVVKGIYYYRGKTREWQRKMNHRQAKSNFFASRTFSCRYTLWVAKTWRKRARATHKQYVKYLAAAEAARQRAAQISYGKWDCIHRHEGAWNSNTGNGYYGGLQMDISFQYAYGREFVSRWGYAHNWPVWAQIAAAERAYRDNGFAPWPNTARMCGQL